MKKGIVEYLKKTRGYEPIDDIPIDLIVRSVITLNKLDAFLNSDKATEYTFIRVIDGQVKLAKIIKDGLHQLGISRRDRLGKELTVSDSNKLDLSALLTKYEEDCKAMRDDPSRWDEFSPPGV